MGRRNIVGGFGSGERLSTKIFGKHGGRGTAGSNVSDKKQQGEERQNLGVEPQENAKHGVWRNNYLSWFAKKHLAGPNTNRPGEDKGISILQQSCGGDNDHQIRDETCPHQCIREAAGRGYPQSANFEKKRKGKQGGDYERQKKTR